MGECDGIAIAIIATAAAVIAVCVVTITVSAHTHPSPQSINRPRQILRNLLKRLELTEYWKQFPGVLDDASNRIERPIIVAGLPRTGTTLMHNMLRAGPPTLRAPVREAMRAPVRSE